MVGNRLSYLWIVPLLAYAAARPCCAQSAEQWTAQQQRAAAKVDKIMLDVNARKGLLDQYLTMRRAFDDDNSQAFHLLFGQYISWYQTFLGAYTQAMDSFSIGQTPESDDNTSPLGSVYTAQPAVDAIPQLAKNYRIVLFNEAHNIALTRSVTLRVLSRLHDEGFNYFAAETLVDTDTGLNARRYPTADSGFYTEEPVYGEMVRTALKLGFKVIAYEATGDNQNPDARESEQAQNLYKRVFAIDPKARLVINAGYDHIAKSGVYLGGASMAQYLFRRTHLSMLSIEQTMMYPHPSKDSDHPYYIAVIKALQPQDAIVFVDGAQRPWSLRAAYDISVFFPSSSPTDDRPAWLSLGGLRTPFPVSADSCRGNYPCLIEARYANEHDDAIPADRLLLDLTPVGMSDSHVAMYDSAQRTPSGKLYLRPGAYHLKFIIKGGRVIHQRDIVVSEPTTHH